MKLHYHIVNGGDGSAMLSLHPTKAAATEADDEQQEDGEGWGESSAGVIEIQVEGEKLFYRDYDENTSKWVWVEAKQ